MPKPPIAERIKILEAANAKLTDKIDRMKAQVRHNADLIRKLKKREDKQDIEALLDELNRKQNDELQRRKIQSERDKQRAKYAKTAKYREDMERRLRQCRIMNGLEPDD
jgi:peptidoglycan hydrolase CwlO-like protein